MPELPEVEYTRRRLEAWMKKGRIAACAIDDARLVRPLSIATAKKGIAGKGVESVDRRGKWLRIVFDDASRLFVHLAMTGWFYEAKDDTKLRFERARLTLTLGKSKKRTRVSYTDPRRWGRWVYSQDDIPAWTKLAPDPLNDKIDPKKLHAKLLRRPKSSIKEALLDQALLAGVGNIQAIEALWRAKIDPRSRAAALRLKDLRAILRAIDWTIARTLEDLLKGNDEEEGPFLIYGHAKKPCPRCKTILEKTELGGRTTTYCPGCQRLIGS